MRLARTLLYALVPATLAVSQTPAPAVRKPVAHRAAAAASTLPPNIPKIVGVVKPLYSLRYEDALIGTGELAEPQKYYTVKYTGWLAKDGTKFDSSYDHPGAEPFTFPYGAHRVIPGWDTGFEGMRVGGKRRLFVPWQLAYGEVGHPPAIPARSDLIFDIELVSFSAQPPAPKASAAPPASRPGADPVLGDPNPPKATPPDSTKPTANPHTP